MTEQSIDVTLAITEAMVDELADYLMRSELYRQMMVQTSAGTKQPKMTLGSLLENLDTLAWQREGLAADQQEKLDAMQSQVQVARRSFPEQWHDLLARELHAVLGSWRWYLEDANRRRSAREDFPIEVRQRTRIEVILQALGNDPATAAERRELSRLDDQLQAMWRTGDFTGPQGQEARYSPRREWWLYGRPEG